MYTRVCKQVCMCVRDVNVVRVQRNLVLIGVEWSYVSLFLRVVIALADNYRLIDNS